jgi:erythromycin esterase
MFSFNRFRIFVWICIALLCRAPLLVAQERLDGRPEHVAHGNIDVWLAEHAIRLKSINPGSELRDLMPLKKIMSGVSIVGLGEATHGSREFFQFKHRLVEFLVKELGFTVFAIEASYPAAETINEYVLYGKGDRDTALASQGLWAWDTREITELIEWLRIHNQTVPPDKKVRFSGFDIHHNERAIDVITSYVHRTAPQQLEPLREVFETLRPKTVLNQHFEYVEISEQQKKENLKRIYELMGFMALNEVKLSRQTSAAKFASVMQHIRILAQFMDVYNRPFDDKRNPTNTNGYTRDFYMAENVERLVKSDNAAPRVIVWAHNFHVGVQPGAMGHHLRAVFGDAYYALGFSFNRGSFQAADLSDNNIIGPITEFTVEASAEGSAEWYFAQAGIKDFLIDFRHSPKNKAIEQWLATALPMRFIGLGYSRRERPVSIRLKHAFDGMVFIEKTTRAQLNPSGLREPVNLQREK